MGARKDPDELARRTREAYVLVLRRAYGRRVPTFVPDYSAWSESNRRTLRAAIKSYWHERGQLERGERIAWQIQRVKYVKRQRTYPSVAAAELFYSTAEKTAPRSAFLIVKIMMRRGLRSEEMLTTPRVEWERALRHGRLHVVGKGSVERVLDAAKLERTIGELLELARNDGAEWTTPGQLLSGDGSYIDTQRHALAKYIKTVAREAGLDETEWYPHALRHVFADSMRHAKASEREIQQALGHASIETMVRYTHPTTEEIASFMDGD